MKDNNTWEVAKKIVGIVRYNLSDRSGMDWSSLDDDIIKEIEESLTNEIEPVFSQTLQQAIQGERARVVEMIEGEIWTHHEMESAGFTGEQQEYINELCLKSHNGGLKDAIRLINKLNHPETI